MGESDANFRQRKAPPIAMGCSVLGCIRVSPSWIPVSFTMGNNTPDADLIVGKPRGNPFWIDVKGQSSKQAWLISPKTSEIPNLFYVLVYLAPLVSDDDSRCPDSFFVLSQADAKRLSAEYLKAHPGDKNKAPGFGFNDPREFRNAWKTLPDYGSENSN